MSLNVDCGIPFRKSSHVKSINVRPIGLLEMDAHDIETGAKLLCEMCVVCCVGVSI